jgi:membrane protein
VLAASLPELGRQAWRKPEGAGWSFRLALEILAELNAAKASERRGYSTDALAERLNVEPAELRPVIEVLQSLDWVGRLSEDQAQGHARQVLLVDPSQAVVAPLADRLLVHRASATDPVWVQTGLSQISLAQMLPQPVSA